MCWNRFFGECTRAIFIIMTISQLECKMKFSSQIPFEFLSTIKETSSRVLVQWYPARRALRIYMLSAIKSLLHLPTLRHLEIASAIIKVNCFYEWRKLLHRQYFMDAQLRRRANVGQCSLRIEAANKSSCDSSEATLKQIRIVMIMTRFSKSLPMQITFFIQPSRFSAQATLAKLFA